MKNIYNQNQLFKHITILSLFVFQSILVFAQFSGAYAPANWSVVQMSGANGLVNTSGTPSNIIITGPDGLSAGATTYYQITIPAAGTISFDWNVFHNDPTYDAFGYSINGINYQITDNSGSGTTSVPVNTGDVFAFYAESFDGCCGTFDATISNFSGPQMLMSYCTTGLYSSGCNAGDYIGDFTLSNLSHLASGCSGGALGYGDFTSTQPTINLTAGNSYTWTATYGYGFSQYVKIWIDLNDNGSFEDAGELVFNGTTANAPSGSFTLSPSATPGNHRLRVRNVYANSAFNSCDFYSYGEVHDYSANISSGVSYCTSGLYTSGCTAGDYIGDFTLANLNHLASGCSGGTVGYGDFTTSQPTINLTAGNSYSWTATYGYGFSQYIKIWIDLNDNGSFLDAGELIFNGAIANAPSGTFSLSGTAAPGIHRMRVRNVYANSVFGPCDQYTYGEVHDYTVNISAPASYCTSNLFVDDCTWGDYLDNFSLANLNHVGSGCSAGGYGDFTTSQPTINLIQGNNYTWNATYGYSSQYLKIWIDLNDNGSFEDAGELIFNGTTSGALTGSFILPGTASVGNHRLRVRNVYANSGFTSCDNWYYGEVHDYTVNISAGISYCTSGLYIDNCIYGDDINSFTLSNLSHLNTGCSPNGYGDFTTSQPTINLIQGTNYIWTATYNYSSLQYIKIWIDFDDNGSFEDAGELIYNGTTANLASDAFTLSPTANPGNHRLRVRNVYNSTTFNSCDNWYYGEVHDYTANIAPASPCAGTPVIGFVTSSPPSLCVSGSATLSLSGTYVGTGLFFQWEQSTDGISWGPVTGGSGATTTTYSTPVINQSIYYQAIVSCSNSGLSSTSNSVIVEVTDPQFTTAPAGDSRCGPGIVNLTAAGNGNISWYASSTGGISLANGSVYSPFVTTTTDFYVAVNDGGSTLTGGKPSTNGVDGTNTIGGIYFTATEDFTLNSVVMYPTGSGSNTIVLYSGSTTTGTPIYTHNVTFTSANLSGETVSLNWDITPGNYTIYQSVSGAQCFRDFPGGSSLPAISYPYNIGSACTLTDGTLAGYYYFFYNWTISSGCESARVPVTATVTPAPAISISSSQPAMCVGGSVTLTVNSSNTAYQYTWQPGGQTGSSITVSPASQTTYTVYADDGNCAEIDSITINVLTPPVLNPTATPALICAGETSQLDAGTFLDGTLSTPLDQNNGSSATGFDITNTSAVPVTLHYFTFQSNSLAGTSGLQSIYYNPNPMNCVFPGNVTTAPGWVLIGNVNTVSNGASPSAPTLIPLDVNITIPAGGTYAFAIGGALGQAYTSGTSGCPVTGTTPHLTVKEGFGGTLTGTIANRRWNGSVTYSYGDPNLTFSWSPTTGLNDPTIKEPVATLANTTTYTVTATNAGGCSTSATVTVDVTSTPPTPTASVIGSTELCVSGDVTLEMTNSFGSIQWQESSDGTSWSNISGANTAVYNVSTVTQSTYYQVITSCGNSSTSNSVYVYVANPQVLTSSGDTRCGPGNVNLSATGTNNITWYDSPVGGSVVGTGNTFSPFVNATTTYYVASGDVSSLPESLSNSTGSDVIYSFTDPGGIMFSITASGSSVTIEDFDIYVDNSTPANYQIYTKAGLVAGSETNPAAWTSVGTATGVTGSFGVLTNLPIPVNITIPAGQTQSFFITETSPTIATLVFVGGTAIGAVGFSDANISVLDGTAIASNFTASFPPYRFKGKINYSTGCESNRVPVLADVTPSTAVTISGPLAICGTGSATLTATSTNASYNYIWQPGSLTGASVTVSPTSTTTYTLYAEDPNDGCTAIEEYELQVASTPTATASASAALVCGGGQVTLNAVVTSGGSGNIQLGTGTASNGSQAYPAPYGNYWWGAKHQMLVLASELQALGIQAGNLTSIGFDVTAVNSAPVHQNYTVKIGHTAQTSMGTTFGAPFVSGLTQVYGPVNYQPVLGVNSHAFSTPFYWDGVSNIIVETCFNNSSYVINGNASTAYSTTSFNSTLWYNADASTVCGTAAGNTPSNLRPNMVFGVSVPTSYLWSPAGDFADPTLATAVATINQSTTYEVTVTNLNTGCTTTATAHVDADPVPTPVLSPSSDIYLCSGASQIVSTQYLAGDGYTFDWGLVQTESYEVSLPDYYTMYVTSPNGCTSDPVYYTVYTTEVVPDFSLVTDALCYGDSTGTVEIIPLGAITEPGFNLYFGPFDYSMNGGPLQSSPVFTGLAAGTYNFEMHDPVSGCIASIAETVGEPTPLSVSTQLLQGTCAGQSTGIGEASATGGVGPYEFNWLTPTPKSGEQNNELPSGTWTVEVVDANGCVATTTITVTEFDPVIVDLGPDRVVAYGSTNGGYTASGCTDIVPVITGGTGTPVSYLWSTGATTATLTGVCNPVNGEDGTYTYTVTITDDAGCVGTGSVTIIWSNIDCSNNENGTKLKICHLPPGNPGNCQTICISINAASVFLNNGSAYIGQCNPGCAPARIMSPDPVAEQITVNVMPNPTNGKLLVDFMSETQTATSIKVMDLQGRVVMSITLDGSASFTKEVDLGNLDNGLYILNIMNMDGLISTSRVVKAE